MNRRYPIKMHRGYPFPHSHQLASGGSDHLVNFFTIVGAVCALLVLVGGAALAFFYSRKATAAVAAQEVNTPNGSLVAVRSSVQALGPFKLKFADRDGAVVSIVPVVATSTGGTTTDIRTERSRPAFPAEISGRPQFVSPGETLTSSVLFRVDPLIPELLGWSVSLRVASKGALRHGLYWADRVFVPVASPHMTDENTHNEVRSDPENREAGRNDVSTTDALNDPGTSPDPQPQQQQDNNQQAGEKED